MINLSANHFIILTLLTLIPRQEALSGIISEPGQKVFEVDPFSSKATVRIKLTFGGIEIPNAHARGELEIHPTEGIRRFWVAFDIRGFESGNRTLNCHLQESLGLDYQKSDFPKKHVCENDRLPLKGKNSVRFPEVAFRSIEGDSYSLQLNDKTTELSIAGNWSIHGVDQPTIIKIQFQNSNQGYRARGKSTISLMDFGVIVKGFLFISVHDEVQVEWDVELRPE